MLIESADKLSEEAIWDLDATGAAEKIRSGRLSSSEAAEAYIRQLENANGNINCLVEERFEEARREAREADGRIRAGTAAGKLEGVPISMKESFDVYGMKTTGGLVHRHGAVAGKDAEIVERLKKEGAVILGKSNTPALCFCQESDNKLYGRTSNPWNPDRTAGGSSGGEGALLAFGGASAGIGSDIGGSIRFPSHFNGVVGFKSGNGQVSQQGSYPYITHPLQERMLGIGPMGKSVRDMRLLYGILSGKPANAADLGLFKVEVLPGNLYPLSIETNSILTKIHDLLEDEFSAERKVPPYFHESPRLWQEMMSIDGGASVAETAAAPGRKFSPVAEYVKERTRGNSGYHTYLSWALIGAKLFKPGKNRKKEIERIIADGDAALDAYLERKILIMPVYHRGAPAHGGVYKEIFSIRKTFMQFMPYAAYANVWGLPSLTVPAGRDHEGMPIGVQIVSKTGNEEAIFKIGERLETAFGGYKRCTLYDKHPVQA